MKKHQPLKCMPSYEGNAGENSTAGFFSISVILRIDEKQLKNCHSTNGQDSLRSFAVNRIISDGEKLVVSEVRNQEVV